jgi:uncharacterized protein YoxC
MEGPLGLKMSEQEVNDYMTRLVQAKESKLEGLEAECLNRWKELTADIAQAANALQRAQAQVAQLTASIQNMSGQRQSYVTLLITAEEGRRNSANPNLELVEVGETKKR